jgi:predicted permease
MFNSYFTIALRQLRKHPSTTAIHLLGLTTGLTTCLLICLFLYHEWGVDRHQPQADRTFRVNLTNREAGQVDYSGITPYPMGAALRTDFPDWPVVASVHLEEENFVAISPGKILSEERILFAEPALLDLFRVEMHSGDARKALAEPNQAILSETAALRYFNRLDVVGRTFRLGEKTLLQVAGVMRDLPAQTNLPANLLVSYPTLKTFFNLGVEQWGIHSQGSVFVRLPEGAAPGRYADRMNRFMAKYLPAEGGQTWEMALQPLRDIHFDTLAEGTYFVPAISPVYLWTFGAIALLVLLIGCINFITLSTARAMVRAREVGIRKAIGATRKQLVYQFLGEAAWLTALSALLALTLTSVLLPVVNDFLDKGIALPLVPAAAGVAGLALLTTVLAGLYPALVLSGFQPVKALKGRLQHNPGGTDWLRQGLIVFQFTISLVLAAGVVVIYQQLQLFREKDLGFRREGVLVVDVSNETGKRAAFREALLRIPGVEAASAAMGAPTWDNNFHTSLNPRPDEGDLTVEVNAKAADAGYAETYGLKLLAGRFLEPRDTLTNTQSIPFPKRQYVFVVNEAAVRAMGYRDPARAVGKRIKIGINDIEAPVIGVVKDFHASSLHEAIKPVVIMNFPFFYGTVGLRFRTDDYPATLAAVERVCRQFDPDRLYQARFLEESLSELYQEEARQFALLQVFAGLALLIGCLGLWGLSVFLIERRTKEIGVRKVLGASVASLVALLSRDFVKLVLLAICIATPIAWYAMQAWLERFAYKITIGGWVFGGVGLAALGLALLTVGYRAIRAARTNPVDSLRME